MTYNGVGWIGIGVSSAGSMIGSLAVITVPAETSDKTIQMYNLSGKYVGTGGVAPSSNQNLQSYSWSQVQNPSSSQTVMEFVTYLDWNNGSLPFKSSGSTQMIYAYGSGNSLSYHAGRASFALDLAFCLNGGNGSDARCKSDDGNYDQMQVFSINGKVVKVYSKLI
jgi:hypothetical protein